MGRLASIIYYLDSEDTIMLVYSVKASTLRFIATMALSVAVLIALILFVPTYGEESKETIKETVSYTKVGSAADGAGFLSQFGWTVDEKVLAEEDVRIPAQFDSVFAGYNELQKQQGLDLSRYKRKKVTHYKYVVTNYEGHDGTVWANLLVYRGRVIGGDICSADPDGFVKGFEGK